MPPFHQHVEIGPRDGSRFQMVIAQVDTSSTYTRMPAAVLTMLGVAPEWTQTLERASGEREEHQLAEVRIRLNGQERTAPCVFGEPGSEPVLGAHTLLSFGLAVDAVNQRLVAATLLQGQ